MILRRHLNNIDRITRIVAYLDIVICISGFDNARGVRSFNARKYRLGELIVESRNFTTHKYIYQIGEKSFEIIKKQVMAMDEYNFIKGVFTELEEEA